MFFDAIYKASVAWKTEHRSVSDAAPKGTKAQRRSTASRAEVGAAKRQRGTPVKKSPPCFPYTERSARRGKKFFAPRRFRRHHRFFRARRDARALPPLAAPCAKGAQSRAVITFSLLFRDQFPFVSSFICAAAPCKLSGLLVAGSGRAASVVRGGAGAGLCGAGGVVHGVGAGAQCALVAAADGVLGHARRVLRLGHARRSVVGRLAANFTDV